MGPGARTERCELDPPPRSSLRQPGRRGGVCPPPRRKRRHHRGRRLSGIPVPGRGGRRACPLVAVWPNPGLPRNLTRDNRDMADQLEPAGHSQATSASTQLVPVWIPQNMEGERRCEMPVIESRPGSKGSAIKLGGASKILRLFCTIKNHIKAKFNLLLRDNILLFGMFLEEQAESCSGPGIWEEIPGPVRLGTADPARVFSASPDHDRPLGRHEEMRFCHARIRGTQQGQSFRAPFHLVAGIAATRPRGQKPEAIQNEIVSCGFTGHGYS